MQRLVRLIRNRVASIQAETDEIHLNVNNVNIDNFCVHQLSYDVESCLRNMKIKEFCYLYLPPQQCI